MSAAVASADALDIDDRFARAGLSGYWSRLFAHADVARSAAGGSAVRAFVQSRVGSVDVYAQHAVLEDFRSDVAKIKVPTLVIHGDSDRILPIKAKSLNK